MFALIYITAVVIAGVPLAITLLEARAGAALPIHRIYRDLLFIGCVILGIVIIETVFWVSLQNYWFGELGQECRYWLTFGLRCGIFAVVFIAVGQASQSTARTSWRAGSPVFATAPITARWLRSAFPRADLSTGQRKSRHASIQIPVSPVI